MKNDKESTVIFDAISSAMPWVLYLGICAGSVIVGMLWIHLIVPAVLIGIIAWKAFSYFKN